MRAILALPCVQPGSEAQCGHNLIGGSIFVELFHFPFVDARGPLLLKFHSQAQGGRRHRSEAHLAPSVLLDGVFC
jgi:hypothetical protein